MGIQLDMFAPKVPALVPFTFRRAPGADHCHTCKSDDVAECVARQYKWAAPIAGEVCDCPCHEVRT
jgi:hypothetical protein